MNKHGKKSNGLEEGSKSKIHIDSLIMAYMCPCFKNSLPFMTDWLSRGIDAY